MNSEKRDASILSKIIRHCNEIDETILLFGDSLDILQGNSIYQNAVSMPLLQVGELAGKLSEGFRAKHPEIPWHKMKTLRNIAVHDYESLSLERIWGTMKEDIPSLRDYCQQILDRQTPEA